MKTETFDIEKACLAQANYVKVMGYPHFAPLNGSCFNCNTNIYKQEIHGSYKSGCSVEKASKTLITGCPHCHYSYCE